jgi:hypothetical protein
MNCSGFVVKKIEKRLVDFFFGYDVVIVEDQNRRIGRSGQRIDQVGEELLGIFAGALRNGGISSAATPPASRKAAVRY